MKNLVRSVCAGAAIGLGGTVFLACDNRVVGAFLFSVGLLTVLVFGFDLFTGKACNEAFIRKPLKLVFIWAGNFVGAVLMGLVVSTHPAIREIARTVLSGKLDKAFYVVIIDGIICEFCIAIAVRGYAKAEGFGRYLAVVLGVMVFILCGAEHVVADMFYLAAGLTTDIPRALLFLLYATLGNVIGGIVWWLAEKSCTDNKQ
ncbi:MAG: formate/nitrite transporter family protein [Lachnospiraceae bacterium]|nr:formate/nitrite transporter family protein [Lachnospiraceae bacterium]